MILSSHGGVSVVNVKEPFAGLTHQTLAGKSLGTEGVTLWQHHMTTPLTIPAHYHEQEETVVVLSGTLRFRLGTHADAYDPSADPLLDAETFDVGPECTCVIPAGTIHDYEIVGIPARVLIFLPTADGGTFLPNGEVLPLPWTT